MRRDEQELLGNVLRMSAVTWFIHTFVETPLHEYGHYWAASFLGAPMYIDGERTIWASTQFVPPEVCSLIFLSGGLFAGLLFLVLFFLVKAPYRNGLLPLVAAEFVYMPLDATVIGDALGLLALVVVWELIFGLYLARFMGWSRPRARAAKDSRTRELDSTAESQNPDREVASLLTQVA